MDDTIGSRIAALRKFQHLTQQDFADRIGCARATVTNYETGRKVPVAPVITAICREFNVSESWLRAGEGEMLIPVTPNEEMALLFGRMVKTKDTDRERLVHMLLKLSDEEIRAVKERVLELAAAFNGGAPDAD